MSLLDRLPARRRYRIAEAKLDEIDNLAVDAAMSAAPGYPAMMDAHAVARIIHRLREPETSND